MSIYVLFIYFACKYIYGYNKFIGIGITIIAIATFIVICKLLLYTYGII